MYRSARLSVGGPLAIGRRKKKDEEKKKEYLVPSSPAGRPRAVPALARDFSPARGERSRRLGHLLEMADQFLWAIVPLNLNFGLHLVDQSIEVFIIRGMLSFVGSSDVRYICYTIPNESPGQK
ncbi:hypothetical protein BHM03_00006799 [Ensete ventricosum]|nr:hypothetical protein BHM03_00006799 [Ensete ventricosum]